MLRVYACAGGGSCDQLLPAIDGTGPRVILADNHTAHHSSVLEELFLMNGQMLVHGPIHSPGFAPAEWGFSHLLRGDEAKSASVQWTSHQRR